MGIKNKFYCFIGLHDYSYVVDLARPKDESIAHLWFGDYVSVCSCCGNSKHIIGDYKKLPELLLR